GEGGWRRPTGASARSDREPSLSSRSAIGTPVRVGRAERAGVAAWTAHAAAREIAKVPAQRARFGVEFTGHLLEMKCQDFNARSGDARPAPDGRLAPGIASRSHDLVTGGHPSAPAADLTPRATAALAPIAAPARVRPWLAPPLPRASPASLAMTPSPSLAPAPGGIRPMAIQKVGVIGCGLMGSGIAQVSAQAGFPTVVREVSPNAL